MDITTRSDALDTLVNRVQQILPAEVYLLDAHPYESDDGNLHIAVIADADDDMLNGAQPAIASAVEEANIALGFNPLLVYHIGQRHNQLASIAEKEGIRL
ncbi:hypothetical protein [Longimonas halophila]|uniref:hypothetical protein n=1 Tax=Longimonas halophila TaxID=1469170 RepID=UPI001143973F|nr:hypothetical protein [Longimonas halophila]